MSDRDDDQRRFMTPPKEWGDASDTADDDHNWLGGSSPADVSKPTQSVDDNDAEAVWLDHAEADDYVNTPHDEGRAAVKHDDEFEVELNEDGADAGDTDERMFEADDFAPTTHNTEPDILTDHHLARSSTPAKRPLWPVITAGCALILVVIGGWGAITERSSLTARIAELESAAAKMPQRGDLSSSEEQSLRDENQRLANQLEDLRDQLSAMARELSELETALSSDLAVSQPVDKVAATTLSNEVANTSSNQDQAVGDTPSDEGNTSDEANIGGWFVNVAAYSQASAAQSWVDKLTASLNENVVSAKVVVNEKTLYRVRIVGLANRTAAQALASRLESSYNIGPLWVGKAETSTNGSSSEESSSEESSLNQTRPKQPSSAETTAAQEQPTSDSPNATASQPVELRNYSNKGGWFIYIDTYSQGPDADAKARDIQSAGYDAKVAVEYRSGELFYRVQVVGINSREEGEAIARALSALGDMPNLQLRQY